MWNLPDNVSPREIDGLPLCEDCGERISHLEEECSGLCVGCRDRRAEYITCAVCGVSVPPDSVSWDEVVEGYVCEECADDSHDR